MIALADFLFRVNQIATEQPKYQIGHDGSDGACDCIGLIKGAIRRAGGTPTGLTGTNYAARFTIKGLAAITSGDVLAVGDVVLKSREPSDSGYDLPAAYKTGGKHYTGDLKDYSHIGVVTGINPLRITHMTSPTAKTDTKIGKWKWYGKLPHISSGAGNGGKKMDITAKVKTPNGGPVNVRAGSGTSFKLVDRIADGESVTVTQKGDRWSRIEYSGAKTIVGWISNEYLVFDSETPAAAVPATITLTLTVDQARAMLAGLEAIEDQIVDKIGRG